MTCLHTYPPPVPVPAYAGMTDGERHAALWALGYMTAKRDIPDAQHTEVQHE